MEKDIQEELNKNKEKKNPSKGSNSQKPKYTMGLADELLDDVIDDINENNETGNNDTSLENNTNEIINDNASNEIRENNTSNSSDEIINDNANNEPNNNSNSSDDGSKNMENLNIDETMKQRDAEEMSDEEFEARKKAYNKHLDDLKKAAQEDAPKKNENNPNPIPEDAPKKNENNPNPIPKANAPQANVAVDDDFVQPDIEVTIHTNFNDVVIDDNYFHENEFEFKGKVQRAEIKDDNEVINNGQILPEDINDPENNDYIPLEQEDPDNGLSHYIRGSANYVNPNNNRNGTSNDGLDHYRNNLLNIERFNNMERNADPRPESKDKELLAIKEQLKAHDRKIPDVEETYTNNIEYLKKILKDKLGVKFFEDLNPKDKDTINGDYIDNTLKLISLTNSSNKNHYAIKEKIIGNKETTLEEYKEVLSAYLAVRQMHELRSPHSSFPELYQKEQIAILETQAFLDAKGLKFSEFYFLKEIPTNIDDIIKTAMDNDTQRLKRILAKENPIRKDIDKEMIATMRDIFGCCEESDLTPVQMQAYNYAYRHNLYRENGPKFQDEDITYAKRLIDGANLYYTNLKESIRYLAEKTQQFELIIDYNPTDPEISTLDTGLANCREMLIKKGLTNSSIDSLIKNYNTPNFDKYVTETLVEIDTRNTATIKPNEIVDHMYEKLANVFDSVNFPMGKELNESCIVVFCNIYHTMNNYVDAMKKNHRTVDSDVVTEHLARIQRFMEIKGLSKDEIETIRNTNYFDENVEDKFKEIAKNHYNIKQLDKNAEVEKNKKELPKEITVNYDNHGVRQKITIDINEGKVSIEDLEPFDDIKLDKVVAKVVNEPNEENLDNEPEPLSAI